MRKNSGGGPGKRRTPAATVDEYLAGLPKDVRGALVRLRKMIRAAAPESTEVISYQVPTFRLGRSLVGFAAVRDRCTFFLMSTEVMRTHAAELTEYKLGKGSIQFHPDNPLPAGLVTRLVKARLAENQELETR